MHSERVEQEIDDLIERGWKIESESPERVVMIKREFGDLVLHLVIFVLTFWTGGLANLAYAIYRYLNSPKRVLRDSRRCPECGASVPADAAYCSACGAEQSTAARERTCPECGATVAADAAFCGSCGSELSP